MYQPNQIVEYNGTHGRVIFHDPITYNVHVMFRLNTNTWKIERCDEIFCKPAQVFLWTIHSAFFTRHVVKTPQIGGFDMEIDEYFMKL
jgi:hypothetical protein